MRRAKKKKSERGEESEGIGREDDRVWREREKARERERNQAGGRAEDTRQITAARYQCFLDLQGRRRCSASSHWHPFLRVPFPSSGPCKIILHVLHLRCRPIAISLCNAMLPVCIHRIQVDRRCPWARKKRERCLMCFKISRGSWYKVWEHTRGMRSRSLSYSCATEQHRCH